LRLTVPVYRALHPRWVFAPRSGKGAALFGGRFNPKETEALYTSLRIETAWLEAQQGLAFKAQPMTICTYETDCADIADLTDPSERMRLGVQAADLVCAWEDLAAKRLLPPSWTVAARLIGDGIAGVLVPSSSPGAMARDVNAVFWRWSDAPPHMVRVIDHHGPAATRRHFLALNHGAFERVGGPGSASTAVAGPLRAAAPPSGNNVTAGRGGRGSGFCHGHRLDLRPPAAQTTVSPIASIHREEKN
jgi:RES domain-containing protein